MSVKRQKIAGINPFVNDAEVFESISSIHECIYSEAEWKSGLVRPHGRQENTVGIIFCPTTSWKS